MRRPTDRNLRFELSPATKVRLLSEPGTISLTYHDGAASAIDGSPLGSHDGLNGACFLNDPSISRHIDN